MAREHYLLVTGRLAEPLLRKAADELAPQIGFDCTVAVMPISIAALMTTRWIAKRLETSPGVTRVMIPGHCQGDLSVLEQACGVPVERGPQDLRLLSDHFGRKSPHTDYGEHDIELFARLPLGAAERPAEAVDRARQLRDHGADWAILPCDPRASAAAIGKTVKALAGEGHRVAIESRQAPQIERAVKAGAELIFSVDRRNRDRAADWGAAVVAASDSPDGLDELAETLDVLAAAKVPVRIDPGLNPIGFGLAASLGRYLEARRRFPAAEMLMCLSSVSDLTEVDSAGLHVLLLGFCQELGVRSVVVSENAGWTQTALRECNVARRLVHYAVTHRCLPRQLDPRLVMLHDEKPLAHGADGLAQLAGAIKDHSYRIFAEGGQLHAMTAGVHLTGGDAYDLFDDMVAKSPLPIDNVQAFYFGYELAKASIALTLGKNYRQDESLEWGMLTVRELTRMERRSMRMAKRRQETGCDDGPKGAAQ